MDYGWLSLVPPIVAIGAAFATRKVIPSLLAGILVGSLIATDWHLIDGMTKMGSVIWSATELGNLRSAKTFFGSWNLFVWGFTAILGIIVALVSRAGGARAYGEWAAKRVKSKKGASFATMLLGGLIFFDDYFNSLTVGTVMKPVTDKFKMSRAKLAYLIDATAAPVVILAPVSSWVAEVVSQLKTGGVGTLIEGNPFGVFMQATFLNTYAWLSLIMVALVCWGKVEFGPMKEHEDTAERTGSLHNGDAEMDQMEEKAELAFNPKGQLIDLILPLSLMVLTVIGFMLYTGSYWMFGGTNSFAEAFKNMNSAKALFWGGVWSLGFSVVYFQARRLFPAKELPSLFWKGFKLMWPAISVLFLAWSIGSIIKDDLKTGQYIATVISGEISMVWLPSILFILSCLVAFSTGTSWGTFGIMIPIAVPLAAATSPEMMIPMVAAILSGAIFGDHSSPISDTTILSSTGAGCSHMDHVKTQFPYALTVAIVSFIGFLFVGFTMKFGWGYAVLINALFSISFLLIVLKAVDKKNQTDEKPVSSTKKQMIV